MKAPTRNLLDSSADSGSILHAIAFYKKGVGFFNQWEDLEYEAKGTPCGACLEKHIVQIDHGLQDQFPTNPFRHELGDMDSFFALAIKESATGAYLGHIMLANVIGASPSGVLRGDPLFLDIFYS